MGEASPDILIVDDEQDLRESVADYLRLHGFRARTAADGAEMRARLEEDEPDLIVLDLNMPGENGLQLVGWLRSTRAIPIIMLTALDDATDRVVGLELGVDDYIGKPHHPRELVARIRTILRRAEAKAPETPAPVLDGDIRFGPSTFNPATGRLVDGDGGVHLLTGMELDLLRAFARNPNIILSRDQLLQQAHRGDWDPFDRSIDVRISRMRRKLGLDAKSPVLRAVRNMGYIFEPGAFRADAG